MVGDSGSTSGDAAMSQGAHRVGVAGHAPGGSDSQRGHRTWHRAAFRTIAAHQPAPVRPGQLRRLAPAAGCRRAPGSRPLAPQPSRTVTIRPQPAPPARDRRTPAAPSAPGGQLDRGPDEPHRSGEPTANRWIVWSVRGGWTNRRRGRRWRCHPSAPGCGGCRLPDPSRPLMVVPACWPLRPRRGAVQPHLTRMPWSAGADRLADPDDNPRCAMPELGAAGGDVQQGADDGGRFRR